MTMTTNERIQTLKPGRSIELSRSNAGRVIAERSGDGRTLRIVRETIGGYEVIRREKW